MGGLTISFYCEEQDVANDTKYVGEYENLLFFVSSNIKQQCKPSLTGPRIENLSETHARQRKIIAPQR